MMGYQKNGMSDGGGAWAGEVNRDPAWFRSGPGEVQQMQTVQGKMVPAPETGGGMDQSGRMQTRGEWVDLRHNLPTEMIDAPISQQEAHMGSLKAMLMKNVGTYIVARFLVGTENMVSCEGELFDVGNDYLIIYQEGRDRYIVSDYFSLKFVEFYEGRSHHCRSSMQEGSWPMMMN